jgi:peptide-methionine (R)-S-oxide reductase
MTSDRGGLSRRNMFGLCTNLAAGAVAWRLIEGNAYAAIAAIPPRFHLADAEWRRRLSPAAYTVLRREGTEAPGSSPLLHEHRHGQFLCAGCALPLFSSATKFESSTGWPSFYDHLPGAIGTRIDRSLGTERTEVHCARCTGHLGHVFDDGPKPTGLRYCMNGVALRFEHA